MSKGQRDREREYIGRRKTKISLEFRNFVSGRERQIGVAAGQTRGKMSVHSFSDPELISILLTGSLKENLFKPK